MYCSIVSAISSSSPSSEYLSSESRLKSRDLNSSRLRVLNCLLDDQNSRSGLEVGWIRRIHVLDTAYWGFLGVGTTHGYAVSSLMDTAYWSSE
ncbi:hypothetical protein Tco_1281661 [Tanacetum coccineum]